MSEWFSRQVPTADFNSDQMSHLSDGHNLPSFMLLSSGTPAQADML